MRTNSTNTGKKGQTTAKDTEKTNKTPPLNEQTDFPVRVKEKNNKKMQKVNWPRRGSNLASHALLSCTKHFSCDFELLNSGFEATFD